MSVHTFGIKVKRCCLKAFLCYDLYAYIICCINNDIQHTHTGAHIALFLALFLCLCLCLCCLMRHAFVNLCTHKIWHQPTIALRHSTQVSLALRVLLELCVCLCDSCKEAKKANFSESHKSSTQQRFSMLPHSLIPVSVFLFFSFLSLSLPPLVSPALACVYS